MRTAKFAPNLVPLLYPDQQTGEPTKTATWRLGSQYDEDPMKPGELIFLENKADPSKPIAIALVTETLRKPFRELTEADKIGHEPYPDDATMYDTFQGYYPDEEVGPQTEVKVARLRTVAYIAVCTREYITLIEPDF